MHIRVKKNPSGSSSVILLRSERRPGKKSSYTAVVKTFGASKDENEIKKLKLEAEEYKKNLEQENNKEGKSFTFKSSKEIESCKSYNRGFHDIYSPIFEKSLKSIDKLTPKKKELLKTLAILRIANPCSKKRTSEISGKYGYNFKVDSAYKLMDKMDECTIEQIKENISKHSKNIMKRHGQTLDVVFYDLSTIYFETNSKDDLRQFGFSKDGKSQHVQITLALLVTKEGLPIGYELFPGNMYEGKTLEPILNKLNKSYKISKIVVVADSGLLNKGNIDLLTKNGYKYIIASRIKNLKKEFKDILLDINGYSDINSDLRSKVISYENNSSLVCCHSSKKARKDLYEREEKLKKVISKDGKCPKSLLPSKHQKPYVKIEGNASVNIDIEAAQLQSVYDGYYALITNIDKTETINPIEVISQYKGLWQIERSFRIIKTDLSIRPVYHWNVKRMMAHFAICYISFALIRFLQFYLRRNLSISENLTTSQIQKALEDVNITQINDKNGNQFNILSDLGRDAEIIYKTLKVKIPKKIYIKD